jgi:hypothetical protein
MKAKVRYTVIVEVEGELGDPDFDFDVIGETVARNGAEGIDTSKKTATVKSIKADVRYTKVIKKEQRE